MNAAGCRYHSWVSYLLKPNALLAPQLDVLQLEETLLYTRATLEE